MADDNQLAKLLIRLQLDMQGMKAGAEAAKESNEGLKEAIQNSWTELKSQSDLVQEYWGMIQSGLDATVGETVAYADQVRTLMREVGASAGDASKLIQAADDVKVSYETLETGMRMAIRNGIQPTMEGMMALADQYVAIQDPVERTRFLLENFGRAGAELGPLMELGADGIREAGQAAEAAGLTMTETGVKSAREYEIAMDNLGDAVDGVRYGLGSLLIPVITNAANTGQMLLSWNAEMDAAVVEHNQHMVQVAGSYDAYVQEMLRTVEVTGYFIDEQGNYVDVAGNVIVQNLLLSESAFRLARDQGNARAEADSLRTAFQEQEPATRAAQEAMDDLGPSLDIVMGSTRELTKEILFQKAAQDLDAEAALALGRHMGVINDFSYELQSQLQNLRQKYDSNKDGLLDAAEAAAGYTDEVQKLYDLYASITDKEVTIKVNTYTNVGSDGQQYLREHGYASGGAFTVPENYPNDSYPFRVQSGERVEVTPANEVSRTDRDLGGLLEEIRGLRADLNRANGGMDVGTLTRSFRDAMLAVQSQ